MNTGVGDWLREIRLSRQMSTAELARDAGIRRATLCDWQTGRRRPRLVELECVLNALSASDSEKRHALSLLGSPCALKRLQQEGLGDVAQYRRAGGSLIRALRLRKRWTQAQAAAAIGVNHSTLAKWERSETWPDEERLRALCTALEAGVDEIVTLTSGPFTQASGDANRG